MHVWQEPLEVQICTFQDLFLNTVRFVGLPQVLKSEVNFLFQDQGEIKEFETKHCQGNQKFVSLCQGNL